MCPKVYNLVEAGGWRVHNVDFCNSAHVPEPLARESPENDRQLWLESGAQK